MKKLFAYQKSFTVDLYNKRQIRIFYRYIIYHNYLLPTAMISVTDKAKEKIIELRSKDGLTDNHNIRVSVQGGGCSGLMYDLDFDSNVKPSDQTFEDKGIRILVDKKSLLYLIGTVLDFSDGLNGKGFQFINPNASRTCGCGESFAV